MIAPGLRLVKRPEGRSEPMAEKKCTRSEQAAQTKKRLTETALRLFAERGYHNVSIADICSSVGVTVGVFYHYFKTKSDVYRAVSMQIDEVFRAIPLTQTDAVARALEILHHYGRETERLGRDTMSVIVTPSNQLIYPNNFAAKLLRQTLETGRKTGQVRADVPLDDQMAVLFSIIWGQVCLWCGGRADDLTGAIDRAAAAAAAMLRP